jgi:hypothetical protein
MSNRKTSPLIGEAKNPGPKDLALKCPQWRRLGSFLQAKVCWSNGVVEGEVGMGKWEFGILDE